MKFKRYDCLLILLGLELLAINSFAQKQTFDVVSFTAPNGWQKSVEANAVQFTKQDAIKEIIRLK